MEPLRLWSRFAYGAAPLMEPLCSEMNRQYGAAGTNHSKPWHYFALTFGWSWLC
jgi:hypothetical protein